MQKPYRRVIHTIFLTNIFISSNTKTRAYFFGCKKPEMQNNTLLWIPDIISKINGVLAEK
jgi:hypothetical protein